MRAKKVFFYFLGALLSITFLTGATPSGKIIYHLIVFLYWLQLLETSMIFLEFSRLHVLIPSHRQ